MRAEKILIGLVIANLAFLAFELFINVLAWVGVF